jgi:hypothetical protein
MNTDLEQAKTGSEAGRQRAMTATERLWRQAIAWQIALAAYMQMISWLPLGRWNYQPCCPVAIDRAKRGALGAVDALGLAAFLLIPLVFALGRRKHRWLAWLSISAYGVWLALQLGTWWPPYLFGASERWSRVYARAFADSTQWLPRWDNHLPPDAMHLVLQALLVGAMISGWRYLSNNRPVA